MTLTSTPIETIRLRLKTLSPVAIGTGEKLSAYSDFIEHKNRLHLIDTAKVEALLAQKPALLDEYVAGITAGMDNNRSHFDLETFLTNRLRTDLATVSRGSYPLGNRKAGGNKRELYTILKTPLGQPYIPGSSLKGAIKTALLYDWLISESVGIQWLEEYMRKLTNRDKQRDAEKQLMTQFDRYQFQVTDSQPFPADSIGIYGTARLHLRKAERSQIPQRWEAIMAGQSVTLSLTFHNPPESEPLTWEKVATCISNFSYNANLRELRLLPEEEDYDEAAIFLNNQRTQMDDDQLGVYLRVGSAKGYFHNSVGLAMYDADSSEGKSIFKEFLKQQRFPKVKNPDPNRFPITRPLIEGTDEPLGWINLEKL